MRMLISLETNYQTLYSGHQYNVLILRLFPVACDRIYRSAHLMALNRMMNVRQDTNH